MSTTNTELMGTAVGTARATHSRRGLNRISTTFLVAKPLRSPRRYMGPMGHHGGIACSLRPHCHHWSGLDGVAAHPFRQFQQRLCEERL